MVLEKEHKLSGIRKAATGTKTLSIPQMDVDSKENLSLENGNVF